MKRLFNALSGKKDLLTPALLLLLAALFFLLHYNVFLNGYYRSHGDFTGIHFSASYILNAVLLDFDIPVWQPYQGLGSVDILSYLTYHPLIASVSALAQAAAAALPGSGYSFFKTTFFAFLLGYCLTFAFGCYLLAKDFISDRFARLSVFAMALFGTQIFFTVYSVGCGIFYLPFVFLFFFRSLSGEKLSHNFSGLIISLGLFLSSSTAYFGQAATMLIILFVTTALLRRGDLAALKKRLAEQRFSLKAAALITGSAVLAAGMLALKAVLKFRLPEFVSAHEAIAAKTSYLANNLSYFKGVYRQSHTNHIGALLENLVNNQAHSPLQGYSVFPRLYYGLFAIIVLLFFWRKIKNPLLPLLLTVTLALFLASTNPQDGYNFILPIMVLLNPLLSLSSRHLNFPVIFAAPFLILALGLALDAFLKEKAEGEAAAPPRLAFLVTGLLLVFASALLVKASIFPRYCAVVIPLSLLFVYLPLRRFPRLGLLPGAAALLLICAELLIPFRTYTKTFYEPFGQELLPASRFGAGLSGPEMRGFPAPFRHSFSFWFDDKAQITTADEYPGHNNAAFKFFSSARPELLNLPGQFLEDLPYLRGHSERLFFVDRIIPAKDQEEGRELTGAAYRQGLHRSAAVVEAGGEEAGFPVLDPAAVRKGDGKKQAAAASRNHGPEFKSVLLPAAAFTPAGQDGKTPSVKLFRAKLPAEFPVYLTSNFLNRDVKDIEATGAGSVTYAPTYFDVFDGEKLFQANFGEEAEIKISGPPPAAGLTLKWKDRLGGLGITVAGFGYNSARFDVIRANSGFLVYMDKFHPRWRAAIDGKPARVYRTNGQFKGVFVPGGSHAIEFRMHDPELKLALLTATLSHLFGIAALFLLCSRGAPLKARESSQRLS